MDFDDDPTTGSIWHIVIVLVIAVLMNGFAVFLLAKAFPPLRHETQQASPPASPKR
jgi:hypothetical protein